MWNIKQEILNGARAAGVQVAVVSPDECQRIRSTILSRYTERDDKWPTWVWEHFTSSVSYADPDGWRWIGDYCSGNEAIMLFADRDEQSMLQFADGQTIAGVVEECFGFEFYLTNRLVDFVLCFNHHNCMIATGGAMGWLEEERTKRERSQSS